MLTSGTLAALNSRLKGTPRPSVSTWCLLPTRARSVGFGPVLAPLLGRARWRNPPGCGASRSGPPRPVFPRKSRCRRFHTSASCHALSRRQQVIPLPQPISRGRSSQATPCLEHEEDARQRRPVRDGLVRPGFFALRGGKGGNSGSISLQSASGNNGLAIVRQPAILRA